MNVPKLGDLHSPPRGFNFLGFGPDEADYDTARVVIVPVAFDATTSYKAGTKYGPAAIIAASREVETFNTELGRDLLDVGIATVAEMDAFADGPKTMVNRVEEEIARHLEANKFCIMLGGEHSLTSGPVRAHLKKWPDMSVLQIDAHGDMRDTYQGSKYSHACVMRRVREVCPAVSVGIRSVSEEGYTLMQSGNLPIFWAKDIVGKDDWHDKAISALTDHVYITFDLDGLDPSIMPGVGTPEPGGLGWYETLAFLKKVFHQRTVVGCDVVELMPLPGQHHSDFTAARLVAAMIGMKFI